MRTKQRARPQFETLEDRNCPAVTAVVDAGSLVVTATTSTAKLTVTQTDDGSWDVRYTNPRNGRRVDLGTFDGVANDVVLNLSAGNDKGVRVDLGGPTLPGLPRDLIINLGNGTNSVIVLNGEVGGNLSVQGGKGAEAVQIGDGFASTTVLGDTSVDLGTKVFGGLTVMAQADLEGDLTISGTNKLRVNPSSTIGRANTDVTLNGVVTGNAFYLNGDIRGDVTFTGTIAKSRSDVLSIGGTIGGSLTAYTDGQPGVTSGGADVVTLTINGVISAGITLDTGGGNDSVSLIGSFGQVIGTLAGTVTNAVTVDTGAGSDTVSLGGLFGRDIGTLDGVLNNTVEVDTGTGNDKVSLGGIFGPTVGTLNGVLNNEVTVDTGTGRDSITLSGTFGPTVRNNRGVIHNTVAVDTGADADVATLSGLFEDVEVLLGSGNDRFLFSGAVAASGSLALNTGSGSDTATFTSGSRVFGDAGIDLDADNDLFVLQGFTFSSALIDGGTGFDTFRGTFFAVNVVGGNFEFTS